MNCWSYERPNWCQITQQFTSTSSIHSRKQQFVESSKSQSQSTVSGHRTNPMQFSQPEKWLLLCIMNQLDSIQVRPNDFINSSQIYSPNQKIHQSQLTYDPLTCQKSSQSDSLSNRHGPLRAISHHCDIVDDMDRIMIKDHIFMLNVLIHSLGARVDIQDRHGWSCIHYLIFYALERSVGEAHLFSSIHSSESTHINSGVDLSRVTRYSVEIESTLVLLLNASEKFGYSNHCRVWDDDIGMDWSMASNDPLNSNEMKVSLLDIQDHHGNTPLHYCVAHNRVDLVGMLLCHGASVKVKNKIGQTVYDMKEWAKSTPVDDASINPKLAYSQTSFPSEGSPSSLHPLLIGRCSEPYTSLAKSANRCWGLHEGLLIEECRYKTETQDGAIKRLIFQQLLLNAVEEGKSGNLKKVQSLVDEWSQCYEQCRYDMFPLVYRGDAFFESPLQIAPAYSTNDEIILTRLLRLPFLYHLQARCHEFAPLHQAVVAMNERAVALLITWGYNINHRDGMNGRTPLIELCRLEFDETTIQGQHMANEQERMLHRLLVFKPTILLPDDDGNTSITYCIAHLRINLLTKLLNKLTKRQKLFEFNRPNKYGSTPIHYLFYRRLPWSQRHLDIIALVYNEIGDLSLDTPLNHMGKSPIQVSTIGYADSNMIERLEEIIRVDRGALTKSVQLDQRRKMNQQESESISHSSTISPGLD